MQHVSPAILVQLNIAMAISDQIVFVALRPMRGLEYYLEHFNLYLTVVYCICLMLVTFYVPTPDLQAKFGLLICLLVILLVLVNILFVVQVMLKTNLMKAKRWFVHRSQLR